MKNKDLIIAVFFLAVIAGSIAAYYFLVKQGDPSGFIEWLKSLMRKADIKANSLVSSDALAKAADLITGFEGFSAKPYWDVDNYSIGYGHHFTEGDGYTANSVVTESEGYQQLLADLEAFAACVSSAITRPTTTNQAAAMISLAYNIGCGNFTSSTLVKKFNAGDIQGAADQFSVWRIAGGKVLDALVSRRAVEQEVFTEA